MKNIRGQIVQDRLSVRKIVALAVFLSSATVGTSRANVVYVTSSGNTYYNTQIKNVLEGLGHTVTIGSQFRAFDGSQSLSGYDSFLLLANYNWGSGDMPSAGQNALKQFVHSGGGLVTGEWTIYLAGSGLLSSLAECLPTVSTTTYNYNGPITYSKATPDPILNAGMPDTFTFIADNYGGTETRLAPKAGATVFYSSSNLNGGVLGWDYGAGRVVQFSTIIGQSEIADANYSRLLSNALTWSSGANSVAVPAPGAALLALIGLPIVGWIKRRPGVGNLASTN